MAKKKILLDEVRRRLMKAKGVVMHKPLEIKRTDIFDSAHMWYPLHEINFPIVLRNGIYSPEGLNKFMRQLVPQKKDFEFSDYTQEFCYGFENLGWHKGEVSSVLCGYVELRESLGRCIEITHRELQIVGQSVKKVNPIRRESDIARIIYITPYINAKFANKYLHLDSQFLKPQAMFLGRFEWGGFLPNDEAEMFYALRASR